MSKVGDVIVKLLLKSDEYNKSIKSAKGSTQGFAGSVTKALGGVVAKFLSVTAAVKGLVTAVKTMAEFERANATLASVLGTNIKGVSELTAAAEDLGRVTEFTASNVTQLQISLARLGFTKDQILAMQESVLKFASAVGTDLGSAADFAGASLRSFGLSAADSMRVLDVMASATSKSALDFSKLQTAISVVGPVAHAFGLSVEDTVALLGGLANAGFDASSAATALRNIILNLADGNGKLAKGLGHTAKTFPEIISALKELKDRGVDLNSMLEMTDKRSVAAFATFVDGAESVNGLHDALTDCDGALEQMYETMTDNLTGACRNLSSAWEGLTLAFRDSTGPIKDVVNWLAQLVNKLTDVLKTAGTGMKSAKDQKLDNDLVARFKAIGDQYGKEEMQRAFDQWVKDADAAYDRAIDTYNAHKTRKNKKAMEEAGRYSLGLSDIASTIRNYDPAAISAPIAPIDIPTTPTATPSGSEDKKAKELKEKVAELRKLNEEFVSLSANMPDLAAGVEATALNMPDLITDEWLQRQKDQAEKMSKWLEDLVDRTTQVAESFNYAVQNGVVNAIDELTEAIGSGEKVDGGAVVKALLSPLADACISAGLLIMTTGEAVEALRDSLITGLATGGISAIAAGAALMAVGAAAKIGLAAIGSGKSSAAGTTSSAMSGATSASLETSSEITVYVEGKIKGSDIVLSGSRTQSSWGR